MLNNKYRQARTKGINEKEELSFNLNHHYKFECVTFYFICFFSSSYSSSSLLSGVDEMYTTVMKFPNKAMATLACTYKADYPNEVVIVGTKGRLRVRTPPPPHTKKKYL